MSSVYPAMKGKFGSTEYYMITMKAADVATKIVIPKEIPGWDDMPIDERFQREINYNRIRKFIAPYLANDEHRFFGSLIIDVINPKEMEFEPLDKVISPSRSVPKLYKSASRSFGFLTLSGGEMLVPLDGQHRLSAIKFAITGKDEKQRLIDGIRPNDELANDDVLLMLIEHDPEKGRKIFNKVNRYAKKTTKADDLITSDDDIIAIISRTFIANDLINSRLVNYKTNTLPASSHYFTTLATIYDGTKRALEEQFCYKIPDHSLPEKAKRELYKRMAQEYWSNLLDGVNLYQSAILDSSESGDERRRDIRRNYLLGKPVCQLSLMIAVSRLRTVDNSNGARLSWESIIERINAVEWSMDDSLWQKILLNGTRIIAGRQAANFAGRFIAYYLGEPLDTIVKQNLEKLYLSAFSEEDQQHVKLPPRLYEP